ncbi:unnamed protein product, partial [Rotaria socialis]
IHAAITLTVPNRQTLLNKLLINRSHDEIDTFCVDIVQSCNKVESITQELYELNDLTKLP